MASRASAPVHVRQRAVPGINFGAAAATGPGSPSHCSCVLKSRAL